MDLVKAYSAAKVKEGKDFFATLAVIAAAKYLKDAAPWREMEAAQEAISCLDTAIANGQVSGIKCNETADQLKAARNGIMGFYNAQKEIAGDRKRPQISNIDF
jgi:hypothetical protein